MNFKLINLLIIIFSLVLLTFIIYISVNIIKNYSSDDFNEISDFKVIKVIDGDTFQLYNSEIIRLICIDTPEEGKSDFEDARRFLESLIMNKEVRLESDIDDKDVYGRSLRYVYVNLNENEIFVNKEMVKYGLAEVFRYGNNTRKCDEIES